MKKKLVLILMSLVLVIALLGCKKEDPADKDVVNNENNKATEDEGEGDKTTPEKVSLKVWAPENQIQTGTMQDMFESFQELHPEWDIDFNVEAQGEDTAKDEILKDIAATADVYFFANDQLAELVDAGAIAKLGGDAQDLVKTTMADTVIDTVTIDDSIYAIPFTHNTFFMFYDKTILTEEDVKTVEGIMAKETADNVYNFHFDSAGGWKLGAWYYGAGNTIYGEDGNDFAAGCDWNNAKGLDVTNYLIDLINNKKVAFEEEISISELVEDHRIGTWFDGSWNYNSYKDVLGDDLGLAVLPTFNPDGNDYQLKGFYGSKAIGVNPHAKDPAVAVAFATYLGSEEMQLKRFEETNQVPTNLVVGESDVVQGNEVAAVIVAEANIASIMQPISSEFSGNFWPNVAGFATEIRSGEFNKDNAQEKLDTFVDSLKVD